MELVGGTDTQRHTTTYLCSGAVMHHVARVQSLIIQTWMLCPSKPSVESCSGAGVHENAGTHLWTRQTHLLCHRELWTHPMCPYGPYWMLSTTFLREGHRWLFKHRKTYTTFQKCSGKSSKMIHFLHNPHYDIFHPIRC